MCNNLGSLSLLFMNSLKTFFLLSSLLLCFFHSSTYAANLKCVVLDSDHNCIPFSYIHFPELNKCFTADQNGLITLEDVPCGNYIVTVSHIDYVSIERSVEIQKQDTLFEFILENTATTLKELVVEADNMVDFILTNTVQTKSLKEYIPTLLYQIDFKIESYGNLSDFPSPLKKVLRTFMFLAGYKNIFNTMLAHPDLTVAFKRDVNFNQGKHKLSKSVISKTSTGLTEKELNYFVKKKWGMDKNPFDKLYKAISYIKILYDKGKLPLKYYGTYQENGVTIHVIGSENYEIHIVNGLWQVYRYVHRDEKLFHSIECRKYHDVFLPIYLHNEDIYSVGEDCKWSFVDTSSFSYE